MSPVRSCVVGGPAKPKLVFARAALDAAIVRATPVLRRGDAQRCPRAYATVSVAIAEVRPGSECAHAETAVQSGSRPEGYGELDVARDNGAVWAAWRAEAKRDSGRRSASTSRRRSRSVLRLRVDDEVGKRDALAAVAEGQAPGVINGSGERRQDDLAAADREVQRRISGCWGDGGDGDVGLLEGRQDRRIDDDIGALTDDRRLRSVRPRALDLMPLVRRCRSRYCCCVAECCGLLFEGLPPLEPLPQAATTTPAATITAMAGSRVQLCSKPISFLPRLVEADGDDVEVARALRLEIGHGNGALIRLRRRRVDLHELGCRRLVRVVSA